jgi:hypothetical protein
MMDDSGGLPYGFLSGPVDVLRAARRAKRVQIELEGGDIVEAGILQINRTGLALITVRQPNK